jgi:TPR repeat protein
MKRVAGIGFGLGAVLLGTIGCGPGAAAEAIRPTDPSAAGALDEAPCREVKATGEPLVVDWKPDQRGDLEIAMREGVAVVAYSCNGIELLKDCHIEGNYGFMGMTRKEQMVRLSSSDELRANLPVSGANIGGELARGATIDIAMVMVGKTKTTWTAPTKDDLKGTCDGATHFVRGATLGAFAMDTGTSAKVRATAEMFGASAEAGSASDKQVKNKEGDLADCAKATPSSDAPPAQCGAPIRLVLQAISKDKKEPGEAPAAAAATEAEAPAASCPEGLVMAEGKCTKAETASAYQCDPEKGDECSAQCDKGHPGSCAALGVHLAQGTGGLAQDRAKAAVAFQKGCDGGEAKACVSFGWVTLEGIGVKEDPAAAAKLFEKGCNEGEALGCANLGRQLLAGRGVPADAKKAAELLDKACDGGNDKSCGVVGGLYARGEGVTQDYAKAVTFYKRACDGSDAESCDALGQLWESGAAGRKDAIVASMMYMRGCYRASGSACTNMGRVELSKPGGGNADQAKRAFQMGCTWRSDLGCAAMKVLYGGNQVVMPNVANSQAWRRACDSGETRACASLGLMDVATGNKPGGMMSLNRACMQQDGFACAVAKAAK